MFGGQLRRPPKLLQQFRSPGLNGHASRQATQTSQPSRPCCMLLLEILDMCVILGWKKGLEGIVDCNQHAARIEHYIPRTLCKHEFPHRLIDLHTVLEQAPAESMLCAWEVLARPLYLPSFPFSDALRGRIRRFLKVGDA